MRFLIAVPAVVLTLLVVKIAIIAMQSLPPTTLARDIRPLIVREAPASNEAMPFVASKRGKYFYPAQSKSAARLAPQNRVYFPDAASAEKAGYRRGK